MEVAVVDGVGLAGFFAVGTGVPDFVELVPAVVLDAGAATEGLGASVEGSSCAPGSETLTAGSGPRAAASEPPRRTR